MQSSSVEWAADHDALHFATVDNFPRFADALLRRKLFVKFGFEPPAAPYSLKENRLEGEGSTEFVPWHFAQTSNVQSAFANAAAWQASNFRFPSASESLPAIGRAVFVVGCSAFRADQSFQTSDLWMKSFLKYWLPLLIWLGV